MKLVDVTRRPDIRLKHKYSVWLNPVNNQTYRNLYAIDGNINLRLILKILNLSGAFYTQDKECGIGWYRHLAQDALYEEFVK